MLHSDIICRYIIFILIISGEKAQKNHPYCFVSLTSQKNSYTVFLHNIVYLHSFECTLKDIIMILYFAKTIYLCILLLFFKANLRKFKGRTALLLIQNKSSE